MNLLKKGLVMISSLGLIICFTGCSPTEVFENIVDDTAETPATDVGNGIKNTEVKNVDASLAQPVFANDISGMLPIAKGGTYEIDGTATSTDGGEITYQWYKNNVNQNGGGTAIEGATEAVYTAKAEEVGSVFYYVVASNNHGDSYNSATSSTFEMETLKDGTWQADSYGKKYVNEDGTYPTECWIHIDGDVYHFDSAGYATIGWLAQGNVFYYFDADGKLLVNGDTDDGFKTDENGCLIGSVIPQIGPTAAEVAAAAEAAAAEAAAQQAAAEAAAQQAAQ